jgi:hypothetical protein
MLDSVGETDYQLLPESERLVILESMRYSKQYSLMPLIILIPIIL